MTTEYRVARECQVLRTVHIRRCLCRRARRAVAETVRERAALTADDDRVAMRRIVREIEADRAATNGSAVDVVEDTPEVAVDRVAVKS